MSDVLKDIQATEPELTPASKDIVMRLLEQALVELRGHRHDFKNLVQNFNTMSTNAIVAHKQVDDIHGTVKMAQGALQAFSSIPRDLADIKSGLITKATDRSGIPYPIVMLLLVLFALLVAIPTWLPLLVGSNLKLNVNRDGLGIESQQTQGQP